MAGSTDTLDWSNGSWTNNAESRAELLIASDWAPIRAYSSIIMNDPESVYGDVLPVLRQSDLRIANLECPLSKGDSPVWKSGSVLKGEPGHLRGLTSVPFEVVTMGNNHVFDHGLDAFAQTLKLLKDHGVKTVGAGISAEEAKRPLIVDIHGIRVAVISFSEGEDLTAAGKGPGVFGWEVDRIAAITGQMRDAADVVIVICHCGLEYIPFPPPYVARAFQRIADAGADLVIGHHPHVPQGVQIHNNTPICYSLGNFVFYQETELVYRKTGYLVKVGLAKKSIARIKIVPYSLHSEGLRLLKNENLRWFLGKLKEISIPLHDFADIENAWHGFLRYYGIQGIGDEIQMILDRLRDEPPKGAAMLRNRITTMQHRQHWTDALTRIMEGDINRSPQWAYDLSEQWFNAKVYHD